MKIHQALLAEFLGTFFLCFAGIAAILSATASVGSGAGIVGIALAHGLALSVAVNAFGGISGAHFNPAVSAAFLLIGRLSPSRFVQYVIVQLAAATVAAAACRALFLPEAVMQAQLGIPLPPAWVSTNAVILAEFIMTFLLMTAIIGTAVDERGQSREDRRVRHRPHRRVQHPRGRRGHRRINGTPPDHSDRRSCMGNWQLHWAYWVAPIAGACVRRGALRQGAAESLTRVGLSRP